MMLASIFHYRKKIPSLCRLAVLMIFFAEASIASPQKLGTSIHVRILNASNGKPMANRDIHLTGSRDVVPGTGLHPADEFYNLNGKTDADGNATFELPASEARLLWFYSGSAEICGPPGYIAISLIKERGVVMPDICARDERYHWWEMKASPNELILFAIEYPRHG